VRMAIMLGTDYFGNLIMLGIDYARNRLYDERLYNPQRSDQKTVEKTLFLVKISKLKT
ncbi:MAG: hypothetical protein ACJATL_000735, partial [Rickettsiales bacterium]